MTTNTVATNLHFYSNSDRVEKQVVRLNTALAASKASSKELGYGLRGATKAQIGLGKAINQIADERVVAAKALLSPYQKQLLITRNISDEMLKQHEVMRLRRKIVDDTATSMVNLGKNTQWAGRQLVVGFTVPLTIAAGAATMAFATLEKQMLKFNRVYGDIDTSTAELKAVAKEVRNTAEEWTKYGVAVADTIEIAASAAGAGFTGKQLLAQTNAATKLAVLGEVEKQTAFKATLALQSTFKQSNEELGQSINYLNMLENQTIVTLQDMAQAIPKAATVVQGLGGSIEDLGTFMAALEEGGVKANEAANALKSGLGALLNPSAKAQEALATVNVSLDDLWDQSQKNGEGVIHVVEELGLALDKLNSVQRQRVIEELFGKHQFARMNALLSNINTGAQAKRAKGVGDTGQLEKALIAQKELDKVGASTLTKFQGSVEKFKNAIYPIGEMIMRAMTPMIEFATSLVEKFNAAPDALKKIGVGFVAVAGIAAPLLLMLLGQIQNLTGNAMKLFNQLRYFGKSTEWIDNASLALNETMLFFNKTMMDQNAILETNASLRERITANLAASARTAGSKLGIGPRRMATGGNVPGTGNGDTVPALLTPGEFVVTKSAAAKFGGILSAMNSGRLRGFVKGGAVRRPRKTSQSDRGYSGGYLKEEGKIPSTEIADILSSTYPTPDEMIAAYEQRFGAPTDRAKMRSILSDKEDAQAEVSHMVKDVNNGKKDYAQANSVVTPGLENQMMNQISGSEGNIEELYQAMVRLNQITDASNETIQHRLEIMDKLEREEHIVLQRDRDELQRILLEADDANLSPKLAEKKEALVAQLGYAPRTLKKDPDTKEYRYPTEAGVQKERDRVAAREERKKTSGNNTNMSSGNMGLSLMMIMTMFSSQISGLTDKLGKFGGAVQLAITALSTMAMLGINPLRGVGLSSAISGKLGQSKILAGVGSKVKNAKWGVGGVGGMVGGILGSMVGGAVSDGKDGSRDAVGNAIGWGATGAGLGMAFGPLGAGIGAAVGALAGFAVQANKSARATAKMRESLNNTSVVWSDIAGELQEKFNLGKFKSNADRLSGVGVSKDNTELYKTMRESMAKSEGPYAARIKLLSDANLKGQLLPGQVEAELNSVAMELKGRGVDDESIRTIQAAFIDSLPEAVRQGFNASTLASTALPNIKQLVKSIPSISTSFEKSYTPVGYAGIPAFNQPNVNAGIPAYLQPSVDMSDTNNATTRKVFNNIGIVGSQLATASRTIDNIINNTLPGSDERKAAEKAYTIMAEKAIASYQLVKDNEVARTSFNKAIGANVANMIKTNQAFGLDESEWSTLLNSAGENSVALSTAAAKLLEAGYSIDGMAEAQIRALGGVVDILAEQSAAYTAAKAKADAAKKDIGEIDSITSQRSAELKKRAWEIDINKGDLALQKVEAELEVTRINLEVSALAEFTNKFNRAFGASIDSFADAQYQIDKIGRTIADIQRSKITPIQDTIDGLNRSNELDQRKIDGLQKRQEKWEEQREKRLEKATEENEKRAEAVEKANDARSKAVEAANEARLAKINKLYDDQAKALQQIADKNDYIANQQQTRIGLADALAKGDLAAAAQAMSDSAKNQSDYAGTFATGNLDTERERAIKRAEAQNKADTERAEKLNEAATKRVQKGNENRLSKIQNQENPYSKKIEAIQKVIEARSDKIRANEDAIYNINKKQIEPLTRKQELMSSMLENSKAELANQQANAKGIDAENQARQRSLFNARKTVTELKHTKTLEQEINAEYQKRYDEIAKRYNLETKSAKELKTEVDKVYDKASKDAKKASDYMDDARTTISAIQAGVPEVIAEWNKEPKEGGDLDTLKRVADIIEADTKDAKKKSKTGIDASTSGTAAVGKYTGGAIPGSGGRDSVPAMLTPGEFVMRRSTVKRIGVNTLDKVNRGMHFATGGLVPEQLGSKIVKTGAYKSLNVPTASTTPDEGTNDYPETTGKLIGDHAAVTSSKTINGGLYYDGGGRHMEPWTSQYKNSGVADISGDFMPVHAYAAGEVVFAGRSASFGPGRVEIRHANGGYTRYGHLKPSSIKVQSGQNVGPGAMLGTTDNYSSGSSNGGWTNEYGHLHFAWRGMPGIKQPKNHGPVPWYAGGFVRLAKGGLAKLKGKTNVGVGNVIGTNAIAKYLGGTRFGTPQFLGNFGPVSSSSTTPEMSEVTGGFSGGDTFKETKSIPITRGKWSRLSTIPKGALKKGTPYRLEGQVNLDVGNATGGRPKQIALRWNRLGWGDQSKGGKKNDPTMGQDFVVTPKGNQFRQTFFHDLQTGGGPLAMEIFVPGKGKLDTNTLIWKYFKGDGKNSGQGSSTKVDTPKAKTGGSWGSGVRAKMAKFLDDNGLSPSGAAAAIGNFIDESKLSTTAIGDGGRSHGLAQWNGGRWTNALVFARKNGLKITDWVTQLKFFLHELKGYGSLNSALKGNGDVANLSRRILQEYERPQDRATGGKNDRERAAYARSVLKLHKLNKGGIVPGAGNFDSVPAMLTPGEMVINKDAVNSIGVKNLQALNKVKNAKFKTPYSSSSKVINDKQAPVVYNNYEFSFEISEASNPQEVANIVIDKFERASRGARR